MFSIHLFIHQAFIEGSLCAHSVLGAGEQKDTSPAVKGLYFMEETGIQQFNTQI